MAGKHSEGRPFDGGAQPVTERPPEPPTRAQSVTQLLVVGVSVLTIVAAVLWAAVAFGR